MRETTDAILPLLREWLRDLAPEGAEFGELGEMLLLYTDKVRRTAKGSDKAALRPLLARIFVEENCDAPWEDFLPILAITEFFSVSVHQSNLGFDQKLHPPQRTGVMGATGQFVASFLTLTEVCNLVRRYFPSDKREDALNLVLDCSRDVYRGQYLDLEVLQLSRAKEFGPEEFMRLYLRRCELMGGGTLEICALGAIAGGAPLSYINDCRSFLRTFGAAAQIVNDIRDFNTLRTTPAQIPPDVRAGKLTLPMLTLINESNEADSLLDFTPEQTLQWLIHRTSIVDYQRPGRELISLELWKKIRDLQLRLLGERKNSGNFDFAWHFVFDPFNEKRNGSTKIPTTAY